MTLKPENKALVERLCGGDWQRPGALDKLLDAARSEGDVSRGGREEENSSSRGPGQHLCADAGPCPHSKWGPIETAEPVEHQSILVKTGGEKPIVGEAWWKEEGGTLDLWWANTSPGDYYHDPIFQCNQPVTHWMPMPSADGGEAVHSPDEGEGSRDEPSSSVAAPPPALPDDVIRLVIAARNVAFDDHPTPEALRELDQASEAFADRVPWEDQP